METLRRIRSHFVLLITVATFGALVGFLAVRSIDVSRRGASAYTPPHLQQAPSVGANLVIEAYVDLTGRVSDYRVISNGQGLKDLSPQIKNLLIFTTFRPATYMGRPIAATAVLSFPKTSSERSFRVNNSNPSCR